MRPAHEIVRDRNALIESRLAEYELRIANAKLMNNLREANRLEKEKKAYLDGLERRSNDGSTV